MLLLSGTQRERLFYTRIHRFSILFLHIVLLYIVVSNLFAAEYLLYSCVGAALSLICRSKFIIVNFHPISKILYSRIVVSYNLLNGRRLVDWRMKLYLRIVKESTKFSFSYLLKIYLSFLFNAGTTKWSKWPIYNFLE